MHSHYIAVWQISIGRKSTELNSTESFPIKKCAPSVPNGPRRPVSFRQTYIKRGIYGSLKESAFFFPRKLLTFLLWNMDGWQPTRGPRCPERLPSYLRVLRILNHLLLSALPHRSSWPLPWHHFFLHHVGPFSALSFSFLLTF